MNAHAHSDDYQYLLAHQADDDLATTTLWLAKLDRDYPNGWTYEEASRECAMAHSFNRLGRLLRLSEDLSDRDSYRLLGEYWSRCDNIWQYREQIQGLLDFAPKNGRAWMMSQQERSVLRRMPAEITVYRGCYDFNTTGLSWTTDKDLAEKFPSLNRYYHHGRKAQVLMGTASKDHCVLKLDRDESEIICAHVRVVDTLPLI